jgi:two-component system osmolarity sensor histidine kinase EnvZ
MSSSPADTPRRWWRPDTLFARLLLLQVLVALGLLVLFGVLVYVERNVAVARLVAERWAPALREAAGWPGDMPEPRRPLQTSETRPPLALRSNLGAPRIVALDDELQRQGVPVLDLGIARGGGSGPVLWLQVRRPDGRALWFGLHDAALLPAVPGRFLLAVLLAAALMVGVSWVFTRRLTRPLEQLRARMQAHRPGEPVPEPMPLDSPTPEIAAIESAYAGLVSRLQRHERERALLLAGVSHDLRGPLARIRMAAGLLPEGTEGERWRESIARNTEVADRLIESFLDHVRSGELALDQRVDVAAVARQLPATRAEGALTVTAPGSATVARSHPLLVERLIANLVDNAFKHGRPPVELRVAARGDRVLIEVHDGGDGVPEHERERLLQAFARGDAARSTPGTGLGLAIVERIVARMGGRLDFERRDGRHVVTVELPAT